MNNFIFYSTPETIVCNCPNQHLLRAGHTCELCMGLVVEGHPADALPHRRAGEDLFDESYFEALESHYEDITYAA